ncbi:MAG: squalene--hopene cyclase [Planctomyces sp.]|nr:squalene--hopene cyclase [Planctomyces sp.]
MAAFLLISTILTGTAYCQDPDLRFGAGVPPEVDAIYDRGLDWLARNQLEDGSWPGGDDGHGGSGNCGITGMCIMAFLASGEDPNFGQYSVPIRKAVQSLILSQSAKTGYLPGSMYHHGFAMLGLAEVYGVLDEQLLWEGMPDVKQSSRRSIGEALELAVRCAVTAQKVNSAGGWRYSPDSKDADTSVAGAVLMGLLASRNAGIRVPDESIENALGYFRQMTSTQGYVGYSGGAGGFSGSRNLQAIATLVYAIGRRKDLDEFTAVQRQLGADLEYQDHSYPEYFRYYMAQAMFQSDVVAWGKWNQMTIRQLKGMQSQDGSFASSHGAAYGTSMSLLCLGLNYRFLPIYER